MFLKIDHLNGINLWNIHRWIFALRSHIRLGAKYSLLHILKKKWQLSGNSCLEHCESERLIPRLGKIKTYLKGFFHIHCTSSYTIKKFENQHNEINTKKLTEKILQDTNILLLMYTFFNSYFYFCTHSW